MKRIPNTLNAYLFLVLTISLLAASCRKEKVQPGLPPAVINSPELITSLILQWTDPGSAATGVFEFRDPDGPGGNPPVRQDTVRLEPNKSYELRVILLDETKVPADTVSHQIWEERDEHQVFFTHTGTGITSTYLDQDPGGLPVGLSVRWETREPASGTVKVVLKHQPGVKNGTEGPGETDVEVTFPVRVN
jgi:hypothetical protein